MPRKPNLLPTKSKVIQIRVKEDMDIRFEELGISFNCSKAEIMRKIMDNFIFLHDFMIEFMKANGKELTMYHKERIKDIEVIKNVLIR